jgi:septal ring-binding cell division protein DamX
MASGRKRGSAGAGERVLEGRHVIGLFMLMLLFSGVFFTLGYVMGRNQYDGQVRAATNPRGGFGDATVQPKPEFTPKPSGKKSTAAPASEPPAETTAAPANSDWEFYHAGDSNKTDDHLKPAVSPSQAAGAGKGSAITKQISAASKTNGASPVIAGGGANLQVAALRKESDAMALANTLRKKNFPTFVQSPQGDKYYHVLVGPYADQKAVDNARKGLEVAGFKAIVKH